MARHEGDIGAAAEGPLTPEELATLIGGTVSAARDGREEAIIRYLSASEGWEQSVSMLGGAFADGQPRLKARKDD